MNTTQHKCFDGKEDFGTYQWRWIPQADSTLQGSVTITSVTNDCGTKGNVVE